MSFLGYLGAGLITDNRIEGSHDADTVLYHLIAAFLVDSNAQYTFFCKGFDGVLHPGKALEETLCNDRFHHVQFQLTCLGCKTDSCIVADYLEANLIGHLWDNWIYLARHDG